MQSTLLTPWTYFLSYKTKQVQHQLERRLQREGLGLLLQMEGLGLLLQLEVSKPSWVSCSERQRKVEAQLIQYQDLRRCERCEAEEEN